MKAKKHGGRRPGAGRKKKDPADKVVVIRIYPTAGEVAKAGGEDRAKMLAIRAIKGCG